jgi:hypothetical protein
VQADESLADRVTASVLSPRGDVHIQLERVIEQEKGIREPAEYRAVLTAVANGQVTLNQIANATGFQERQHVVRRVLEVLEDLELVRRERNFASGSKAPYRYLIADNALLFWYRFVYPHRSRLETGDPRDVWEHHVEEHLDDYMGKVFEGICREAFIARHRRSHRGVPETRFEHPQNPTRRLGRHLQHESADLTSEKAPAAHRGPCNVAPCSTTRPTKNRALRRVPSFD